jgi:hypothetical protein
LRNVWLGVSVENQAAADERIPVLLKTPAALRFISAEPLLGPVKIPGEQMLLLDWIICGGESGPHARPMHPDWARSLRNQCVQTDTAFFFKQWGKWIPYSETLPPVATQHTFRDVSRVPGVEATVLDERLWASRGKVVPLLDGREWKEFPVEA